MLLIAYESRVADAGLIHIYHRYRPKSPDEALNSSSSQVLISHSSLNQQDERIAAATTKSIEYTSPIKRIMELIGHHSPVIVVSDSPSNSNAHHMQHVTDVSTNSQNLIQTTAPNSAQKQTLPIEQPQWALLDANQAINQQQQQQPILATQQQQLYQSVIPYEQYYISPNTGQQAIAVLPTNMGFNPGSYQQLSSLPFGPLTPELQAQQASVYQQHQQSPQLMHQPFHQNSLEDKVQPIFLSSYVPELPVQARPSVSASEQARPDSIQQVQALQPQVVASTPAAQPPKLEDSVVKKTANEQGKAKESSQEADSADENDGDSPSSARMADEPDDGSSTTGDIEEPTKSKRSSDPSLGSAGDDQQNEEPTSSGNSGSMSYEDKYDSDKTEPRSVSINGNSQSVAESSNKVLNGLVNVGLNDDCLQCICRASSGCDHLLRCITRGSEEKYCGPFQLTEEYWQMAGSPGDAANNFQSFEDCANEADCAVETVTNYMKKYHKDCDGDENITCMDYARLHKLKPAECENTEKLDNHFDAYWAKFQRCAEGYNRSRNGDDEDIWHRPLLLNNVHFADKDRNKWFNLSCLFMY